MVKSLELVLWLIKKGRFVKVTVSAYWQSGLCWNAYGPNVKPGVPKTYSIGPIG